MKTGPILNFLGILLMLLGGFMLLPIPWAWYYGEEQAVHFVFSALITVSIGFLLWKFSSAKAGIQVREGFAIVSLGWLAIAAFGALPFLLTGAIPSVSNAVFESMSGFTTTGASILSDVEALPKCVLFWRSFTHWLGGMGIIVFSLAILPILGVGGMQLYRTEVAGPTKDKLTPRISQTAQLLWGIYVLLSALETVLLWLGGMNLFDALCHTFGTVATGGFSTRNASINAYENPWIHWVIIVFMFLSGTSFALHYRALAGKPILYWRSAEFRFYAGAILIAILFVMASSWSNFASGEAKLRDAVFVVVSQATCTGFCTADYERWSLLAMLILIIMMFFGG
ncbi:MAG: potassium transporter TrkG, partial [bacterium]